MHTIPLLLLVCVFLSVLSLATQDDPAEGATTDDKRLKSKTKLSVLLLTGIYIGHQFPLLALGEELVSRGHRVAIMGPLIEGSTVLSNLSQDVGVEFINAGFMSKRTLQASSRLGTNFNMLIRMVFGRQSPKEEDDVFDYVTMLKDGVDSLNAGDWNYVVADNAAVAIMYYIMQEWKTTNTMVNLSPLGAVFRVPPPWPSPMLTVPVPENMSFTERLVNTIFQVFFTNVMMPLLNRMSEGSLDVGIDRIDYYGNMGLSFPVLFNTVLGFDYPKTRPPLVHYTGPLLLKSYPPLDSELLQWLKEKDRYSVIYISMGTSAELTPHHGRSILNGIPNNYSIVWSLRESNRNILEGMKIDWTRVYIAEWVSQVTFLQHETVAMAILHCGIGGVQEALYHKVPVICVPYAFEQFDTAVRVDGRFGVRLLPSDVTQESVSDAVSKIGSGRFQDKVDKISIVLRQGGGAKKAADLVELYSEVGHQHGIPAFVKYKWSWIQYYNVDVWGMLLAIAGSTVWMSVKCFKYCFRKCCSRLTSKNKKD